MSWYQQQRGKYHVFVDKGDVTAIAHALNDAASAVKGARYVLITTGAGMGCDSGIPDFRGGQSFFEGLNHPDIKTYEDMSDDAWFRRDVALAWGLNVHQMKIYRDAEPHEGFHILRRIWEQKGSENCFVYTSNVDGQTQKAGFDPDRIYECHGQIHRLQCTKGRKCGQPEGLTLFQEIEWNKSENGKKPAWMEEGIIADIPYDDNYRVTDLAALPLCGRCGSFARPNLWFCYDENYVPCVKNIENSTRYREWREHIAECSDSVVVIECGGGTVIPSVRTEGELLLEESEEEGATFKCTLIRINPTDYGVPAKGAIGLPFGAKEGLQRIEERLKGS